MQSLQNAYLPPELFPAPPAMAPKRDFNGCWTCRDRHVKCDMGRPSCERCRRADLVCAGYYIKLKWVPFLTPVQPTEASLAMKRSISSASITLDEDAFRWHNASFVKFPTDQQYATFDEVDPVLDRLADPHGASDTVSFSGPFGVFHAGPPVSVHSGYLADDPPAVSTQALRPTDFPLLDPSQVIINAKSLSVVNQKQMQESKGRADQAPLHLPPLLRHRPSQQYLRNATLPFPAVFSGYAGVPGSAAQRSLDELIESRLRVAEVVTASLGPNALWLEDRGAALYQTEPAAAVGRRRKSAGLQRIPYQLLYDNDIGGGDDDGQPWVHKQMINPAKLTIMAIKGLEFNDFLVSTMLHLLFPTMYLPDHHTLFVSLLLMIDRLFRHETVAPEQQVLFGPQEGEVDKNGMAITSPPTSAVAAANGGFGHYDYSLVMGPLFRRLLGKFAESLDLLMVVVFKGNIWETYIVPRVMQCVGEWLALSAGDLSGAKQESLEAEARRLVRHTLLQQVLLFAAIGTARTSHLKEATLADLAEKDFYLKLGIEFRNRAHHHIKGLLKGFHADGASGIWRTRPADDLILAVMLQVRVDNMFGIFDHFKRYFRFCLQVVSRAERETWEKSTEDELPPPYVENRDFLRYTQLSRVFFELTRVVDEDFLVSAEQQKHQFPDLLPDYNLLREVYSRIARQFGPDLSYNRDFRLKYALRIESSVLEGSDESSPKRVRYNPGVVLSAGSRARTQTGGSGTMAPPTIKVTFNARPASASSEEPEAEASVVAPSTRNPLVVEIKGSDSGFLVTRLGYVPSENSIDIPLEDQEIGDAGLDPGNLLFGLPDLLVELFGRIIDLSNQRHVFVKQNQMPRNFTKICADLHNELLEWRCDWRLYDERDETGEKVFFSAFHEALYHNILLFRHGLIVYFLRLLLDRGPELLQNDVEATLEHMEELKRLECRIQPLFWQYFVLGCDATSPELQEKYSSWFDNYSTLTNHWRAKQVMYEVWRQRADGDPDVCWIDVVRDWDFSLFLG